MHSTFISVVVLLVTVTLVASSPLLGIPITVEVDVDTRDVDSIMQLKERCHGCEPNDLLDVLADVDAFVKLDNVLDLDTIVSLVLNASAGTPSCHTPGCNEIEIMVWAKDFNVKINAILVLLGNKKDSHKHLIDLVAIVDASLSLLAQINIDTSKGYGSKHNDLVKIVASLLSNTTVSLSTCGILDLDIVSKIDVALSSLLVALDLHVYGLAGLCGASVTHVDLFVKANLKLTLKALGL